MKRYFHPFWITVMVVLSIILVVMLFPIVEERYGATEGGLIVAACVLFIWAMYFVRAHFILRYHSSDDRTPPSA